MLEYLIKFYLYLEINKLIYKDPYIFLIWRIFEWNINGVRQFAYDNNDERSPAFGL